MKGVLHNGMSLFQDLKLKRRKVDSRCSSDGESIGTSDSTASLSPDAQTQNGEGSPKNKERCVSPEDLIRTTGSSSGGGSAKMGKSGVVNGFNGSSAAAASLLFMMKADRKDHHPLSASSKLNFINLHQNGVVAASSAPNKIETARNGVIKLTNGESHNGVSGGGGESPTKAAVLPNGEASLPVENGFSTKKSRASSLEKITEEDTSTAAATAGEATEERRNSGSGSDTSVGGAKSPLQINSSSPLTSTSPLSSAGSGHSNPPSPAAALRAISPASIKTEKDDDKMEVDEEASEGEGTDMQTKMEMESGEIKIKREREVSPSPQPASEKIVVGDKRKFSSLSPPHQPASSPPSSNGSNSRHRELLAAARSPGKMSNSSSRSSSPPSFLPEKYARGLIGERERDRDGRPSPPNSVKSNGSRVPSPQDLHTLRQSSPLNPLHQLSPQQQHMLLSQQSQLHARLLNGPPPSQQHQHQHQHQLHNHLQHLQHPGDGHGRSLISSPSSLVHAELRNLTEKPDPLSVITPTSLSFHHHSMYRINGVRPEVISGGAVTPTTNTPNGNGGGGGSGSSANSINSGSGSGGIRKSPSLNRSPNSSPRSNASSVGSGGSTSTNNTHLSNGSLNHLHNHSPPSHVQQQNLMNAVAGNLAMINSMSGQSGGGPNGGSSNSSNASNGSGHNHVNLNRTPTVIMGEAGGVRTMLWSQPGATVSPDLGPSPNNGGSPTVNGHHYGIPSPHHTHSHLTNGHSNNSMSPPHHLNNSNTAPPLTSISAHLKGGLSMERLWASEAALNLSTSNNSISNGYGHGHGHSGSGNSNSSSSNGQSTFGRHGHGPGSAAPSLGGHGPSLINGHHNSSGSGIGPNTSLHPDDEDYEQPMICMICEDRATGLHYGIITCEGCKGFFKRTVQNRRVYTCVADGTCEITKAQRNRCQYCRFKKCIEQGMVLQAVREDRMPGGRNSGAVYNLYKVPVKYRKHKKGNRAGGKPDKNSNNSNASNGSGNAMLGSNQNSNSSNGLVPSPGPAPSPQQNNLGNILKAALTSPNEMNHLRPTSIPFTQAAEMITNLVQCDNFHDIAALQNWEDLLEGGGDLSEKLCQMGDSIVYRLVQWTKRLPFYQEVPVDVHTRILTHKWHELLVLTTSAWQAMYTPGPTTSRTIEEESMDNLRILQRCLEGMMGRSLTLEQLRQDVGQMVERLTYLTRSFRRLGIRKEEYVTLKVIAMLQNGGKSNEVGPIQERYIKCLGTFLEATCPSHTNRLNDLLRTLPEVREAAALLLESKMFYVPFLLNSALQR